MYKVKHERAVQRTWPPLNEAANPLDGLPIFLRTYCPGSWYTTSWSWTRRAWWTCALR